MFARILSVGGWTLGSRLTGFVRDIVTAAAMGVGPVADAFVVAFRLPNHFRAIFGEGAFNAAFIPGYARLLEREGEARARAFAGRILAILVVVQLVILAAALAFMPGFVGLLAPGLAPETFALAVDLTRITFPYLLLITLVTLISAILNAHDRFAAAAGAPILLNVCLVGALSAAWLFPTAGHAAAWGVAAAGLGQLLLVWADAARAGIMPRPARPRGDPELGGFFRRLGPAVAGSAGVQIAMFADTIIASVLPAGALASLYYAERLYQLPLGVVGIAAGTVLLPTMTRLLAANDPAAAHAAQNRAIGFTLALAAPCAVAFLLVPDLVMRALFARGAFDAAAAERAGSVLAAYAVGLPAAVILRSVTASFFARGDTATPLWATFAGYGLNVALKIALTGPFGVAGLALATSAGAWLNVAILWALAVRRGAAAPSRPFLLTLAGVAAGCGAVALVLVVAAGPASLWTRTLGPLADPAALAGLGAACLLAYGAVLGVALRLAGIRLRRG